jgi:hypothetical protein
MPKRVRLGAISRRISIHLPPIESSKPLEKPVTLPPGCAMLATKPSPTGSDTTTKTIGIVRVARMVATAPGVLRTNSAFGRNSMSSRANGAPPLGPPELPERGTEQSKVRLNRLIALARGRQYADALCDVWSLRPRRERPRRSRAAEQSDEVASL